jgi:hypothetical protein
VRETVIEINMKSSEIAYSTSTDETFSLYSFNIIINYIKLMPQLIPLDFDFWTVNFRPLSVVGL